MPERQNESEQAEQVVWKLIREADGKYSPREVLDAARHRNVSERAVRSAMLRLLDAQKLQLGRDRKLSARTS